MTNLTMLIGCTALKSDMVCSTELLDVLGEKGIVSANDLDGTLLILDNINQLLDVLVGSREILGKEAVDISALEIHAADDILVATEGLVHLAINPSDGAFGVNLPDFSNAI